MLQPPAGVTTTENVICAVLCALSVAVHVTGVVPMGKTAGDAGRHDTGLHGFDVGVHAGPASGEAEVEQSTSSVAVGVYDTVAPFAPVAGTVMLAKGKNVGATVSPTVTVNVALELFPTASVAVHVTGVMPIWNMVFGGGEHATLVPGGGAPASGSPSSIAVGGMKNTTAPHWLVAWLRMLLGTVVGAEEHVPIFPIQGGMVSAVDGG